MSALDEVVGYNRHTNICMYSRGNGDCNCVVGGAKKELAALRTENARLKAEWVKLVDAHISELADLLVKITEIEHAYIDFKEKLQKENQRLRVDNEHLMSML